MNYRHAYHAGNFADVLKHAVLALVIERLKLKDAPFRVIDTHAGIGCYDLASEAASRTAEWRDGIGRIVGPDAAPLPADVDRILAPYLDVVRALNPRGVLERYPGSPALAQALLRPQDRLVVNELHPEDAQALRAEIGRDARVRVLGLDGWTALKSTLPPKERRGVILVDPPFEQAGELERLGTALDEGLRRFATGVFLLWYPIKARAPIAAFHRRLTSSGHRRLLAVEVAVYPTMEADRLNGCGLVIANPPWQLAESLGALVPHLTERLAKFISKKSLIRDGVTWLAAD